MSYSRHNWECGEVVTNEKLNNIEDGIEEALECCGSGGMERVMVTFEILGNQTATADYTVAQLADAWNNGAYILGRTLGEGYSEKLFRLVYAYTTYPGSEYFIFVNLDPYKSNNNNNRYMNVRKISMQANSGNPDDISVLDFIFADAENV